MMWMRVLWADQIILVNKGTVIHAGTPEEVFTDPALIMSSNLRMPAVLEVYTEARLATDGQKDTFAKVCSSARQFA